MYRILLLTIKSTEHAFYPIQRFAYLVIPTLFYDNYTTTLYKYLHSVTIMMRVRGMYITIQRCIVAGRIQRIERVRSLPVCHDTISRICGCHTVVRFIKTGHVMAAINFQS